MYRLHLEVDILLLFIIMSFIAYALRYLKINVRLHNKRFICYKLGMRLSLKIPVYEPIRITPSLIHVIAVQHKLQLPM